MDGDLSYDKLIHELDQVFGDDFMQPEIIKCLWINAIDEYSILDDSGYDAGDYESGDTVYLARLSASGYMDCTEWTVYDSFEDAAESLISLYGE